MKRLVIAAPIAAVLLLAGCSSSSDSKVNSEVSSAVESKSAETSSSQEPPEVVEAVKVGTRENPAPQGTSVPVGKWTVTVSEINLNANEAVLAEDEYSSLPEGYTWVTARVTAAMTDGPTDGQPVTVPGSLVPTYVTQAGAAYDPWSSDGAYASLSEDFFGLPGVLGSATVSGRIALAVPSGEITGGLFAVLSTMSGEIVYFQVQ